MADEPVERVLRLTRRLAAPFELSELLREVIEVGRAALDADRGTVFLYDDDTNELVVEVGTGLEPLRLPADRGIVGECATTRQTIVVPDAYADPRFNPSVDKESGYRTRCLLTVPLVGYDDSLVGVLQLLNRRNGVFGEADEGLARTLAAQCAVAIQRVQMTEQIVIKEKQDRELALARDIQVKLWPRRVPAPAGYEIAGSSRPADETGGDTFDVIGLDDDRVVLLLGDATGHGIGPALSVTQLRAMLRIALRLNADLDALVGQLNDQLDEDLAANRFITAFIGQLDGRAHRVSYHAAGQSPLLHLRADGSAEWHSSTSPPLGMLPSFAPPRPASIELAPGDLLALITDGVYEQENEAGEMFERDRVAEALRADPDAGAEERRAALIAATDAWAGDAPQADDITILIVRRLP